jgi:uncharacterized protein (TIGR03437 family)
MRRLWVFLALAPGLLAYVRLNTASAPVVPITRTDNTAIQFYLNTLVVPGVTAITSATGGAITVAAPGSTGNPSGTSLTVVTGNSNPLQALGLAQTTWNQVTTARVNFLPIKYTTSFANGSDYVNVISIASTANDLSVVTGTVAITVDTYATSGGQLPSGTNVVNGDIVDSDILLNPAYSFSTDGSTSVDMQAVMTHEFGHTLSANHTGLLGATMFQYTAINQRFLSMDDLAFVNAAYPASGSAAAPLGTISGTITVGGAPVPYALMTMIDTADGITISGLSNPDGTFSEQVPPGMYLIYAEPFNAIVKPGNLYFTAAQATLANSVSFVSTFFGGNSAPTPIPVTANSSSAANIAVTALPAGQAPLAPPYFALAAAGGSNDITSVNPINGPQLVASGQSVDLAFVGPGFDSTLTLSNVQVFGPGITATHIGLDPGGETVSINGTKLPVVRLTVAIAARQNADVATIFVNKGSTPLSTLSLSGMLVITPPTPAFASAGVTSSASYVGSGPGQGAVSPGGIYAIYSSPNGSSTLGPAALTLNAGYNGYGFLSTQLAGVNVTFDGIAAPLFYAFGGQLAVQAPFEVAGKTSTKVVVNFYGSASAPISVPVLAEQPAFFTITPEGSDSIIVNPDGVTINSKNNPAARGGYVTAYGTGVGNVAGLVTGQGAPLESTLNYNCLISNVTGTVTPVFVGWTPTAVGLAQFTFQVPASAPANSTQTLRCFDPATNASTPTGTLYIGN